MNIRATIKDVAKTAGVSIATVSNVLNGTGRVSSDTIKMVQKAIDELQFVRSASARSLKDKQSQMIAVVVPFLEKGRLQDNPFYWQLVTGIEEGARNHRLHVLLIGADEDESYDFVHERHLDGVIVIGVYDQSPVLEKIIDLQVPCVFMDSYLSDPSLVQVYIDDEAGGYIGTRHLIGLGHQRIALLTGKLMENGVNYKRWLGYRRALDEAGIIYDDSLIMQESVSSQGGYQAAQKIGDISHSITAVFAFSDVAAMGMIKGFHDIGISVPHDISVMGFDNIFYCDYMIPSLTTVGQDIIKKGQTAVSLLLEQIGGGSRKADRNVVLPVSLKVRQSTGHVKLKI